MRKIDRESPEWKAIREYVAARDSELMQGLRHPQTEAETADKRSRLAELAELIKAFVPEEIEAEPEIYHGV